MAKEASAPLILTTKLHRPPLTPDLVFRPRLIERLNQRWQQPLILISAGAGYGKSTLVPEGIAELHRRASRWFGENDLLDEAIQHALLTGDIALAVQLVAQHRYDLMNTEQWQRLDRWLKMLPPETVEKNPILLVTQAYLFEYRGQILEAFAYRDQAETFLPTLPPESPESKAVRGEIAVLHGEQHLITGEGDRAIASAELALKLLPPEALHSWSFAIGEQVLANQMAGDIGRGLKIVNKVLNERALSPGLSEARMMLWFCMALLPESLSFGRYFLGVFHYVRNRLPEAERYLAAVVDDPFTARSQYLVKSVFALALIYTTQGRDDEASRVVESVISHTKETNDTLALTTARAMEVDLAPRQGKVLEAQRLTIAVSHDGPSIIYDSGWRALSL